jgi:hypothetical protein
MLSKSGKPCVNGVTVASHVPACGRSGLFAVADADNIAKVSTATPTARNKEMIRLWRFTFFMRSPLK